jgi:hypothetical protein
MDSAAVLAVGQIKSGVDDDLRSNQSGLVSFGLPSTATDEDRALAARIIVLDHRSLRTFGAKSASRAEIRSLLVSAVAIAGYELSGLRPPARSATVRSLDAARDMYRRAEEVFYEHLQSRNRLTYFFGVLLGMVVLTILGLGASLTPPTIKSTLTTNTFVAEFGFAGFGVLTSVLLRLGKLELREEISIPILLISGVSRPLVGGILALVVFLAIWGQLIPLQMIGSNDEETRVRYFVLAFLCGFSERLAEDLLTVVEGRVRSSSSSAGDRPPRVENAGIPRELSTGGEK